MARQHAVGIENGLPLRVRRQQRHVFRARAREQHGKGNARVDTPPQLTVDEVAQTACPETKRDQRCDKIGNLEEVAFGAFGKNHHHQDHPNQAAVEGHAAVPDAEQIERVIQEYREVIEQHISNSATQEHAEEARIEQVFNFVFSPAAARTAGATAREPHGKNEAHQVHQTVPVKRNRSY